MIYDITKATARHIIAIHEKTPNDSCLSGPILKCCVFFPFHHSDTNKPPTKTPLTSNPNPPTPQTHHLAATYQPGTPHHLTTQLPNGPSFTQRGPPSCLPGAKRTKRRRSCRTSCGSSSKSRSSRRRWPRCRWLLLVFDGDVSVVPRGW